MDNSLGATARTPPFGRPVAAYSAAGWLKARSIALKTWLGANGFATKPRGRAAFGALQNFPVNRPERENRRYRQPVAQQAGQLGAIGRSVQSDIDKRQSRAGLSGENQSLRPGARNPDHAKSGDREHCVNKARDQRLALDDKNARRLACARMRNHLNPVACHRHPNRRLG